MRDRRSNAEAQAVREVRAAHEQREVISELQAERDGLDAIIARMQAQDVLAIKQWQAANPGNDLRWPDKMRLTAWCMTEFAKAHAECERLRLGGCARGQTTVQMQAERDEAREMLAQATHDSRGWGDYGASTVTGPRAPSLHTLAQRVEALEHRMRNR